MISREACTCYAILVVQIATAALSLVFWAQAGSALRRCHRDEECGARLWLSLLIGVALFPVFAVGVLVSMCVMPQTLGATRADIQSRWLKKGPTALWASLNVPSVCLALMLWWGLTHGHTCEKRSCFMYGQIVVGVLGGAVLLHIAQMAVLYLRSRFF